MIVRRRVIIHGIVQGVFFRETIRRAAVERRVAGSARNHRDGTVEVVLEGSGAGVADLLEACRQGPPDAQVERLEVTEEAPEGLSGFSVT